MPALAAFGAFLARMVASRAGYWIVSILAFFGLQMATSKLVVGPLLDQLTAILSGAPAQLIPWIRFLQVDVYVTMVLSAYATAASLNAVRLKKGT